MEPVGRPTWVGTGLVTPGTKRQIFSLATMISRPSQSTCALSQMMGGRLHASSRGMEANPALRPRIRCDRTIERRHHGAPHSRRKFKQMRATLGRTRGISGDADQAAQIKYRSRTCHRDTPGRRERSGLVALQRGVDRADRVVIDQLAAHQPAQFAPGQIREAQDREIPGPIGAALDIISGLFFDQQSDVANAVRRSPARSRTRRPWSSGHGPWCRRSTARPRSCRARRS